MTAEARVAWREGLFLRQQHLQQQDRHTDRLIGARVEAGQSFAWGLTELKINAGLAALGTFAVERLVGVMPDGTPFAIPDTLPPPPPIEVPADARDAVIHLTLPAYQPGAVEFRTTSEPGADAARFLVDEVEVADAFAEERTREVIEIARPNLRFGVTREQTYGRVTLGLARVREVTTAGVAFDDRYIPPALAIRSSGRLTGWLADIIGRMGQRIDELAVRAVQNTDGGSESFATFLLLQALNRYQQQLQHLRALPAVHPERLYEMLLGVAGDLATLTREDRRPPALPSYDHATLQAIFEPVVEAIQAALSAVYDRAAIQLPLQRAGPGAYTSRITDPALYQTGYFYLAVSARMPLDDLRARFPSVAKIGTVQNMRQIVDSALSGVPLQHSPTPPPQIRALPGFVYFELDRSVAEWADFAKSPALGLHIAGDWPELRLELWCVKKVGR
ncbi:type VI secretion system baseplate subunit TssK [Sphingomonas sp. H39-1-10]|uniref:type VI secretion system baseplate subunit TssK n=1 Tax=Sphingomonas pollutisoli TaxID=3030829 RepID=UPI0023B9BE7E|nr:type VI secretion system baseplate subunit TssK [Sphingomonas pollutisoli]MDF0487867.1 type VI secretion system baseplate subunit TssK [Sphingomonas pollutisoli]